MNKGRIKWKAGVKTLALTVCAVALAMTFSACDGGNSEVSSGIDTDPSLFPTGTTIGGENIGGQTVEEALETAKKALDKATGAMEITVKFKDDTVSLSGADFTVTELLELELPRLLLNREAQSYPLSYVTDLSQTGKQKLTEAAKTCVVQAKEATVSGYNSESGSFTFTDEQKGSRVDMAATLKSVRQLLSQKRGGDMQVSFTETTPKMTKEYLTANFKQMASYQTVSTNTENGNSNMRLALSHVNGTILQPGDSFSYNTTIGNSTDPGAGWLPAGGIAGGILVQMYGGGICQGSTTLYNAALLAGMEITERSCHSMPSSYCPIGLDATVDYGNLDFRFRNPLDTPIYIAAWMDGVTLTTVFYGCFPDEWDKITVGSEQTGMEYPLNTVSFRTDTSLASGEYVRKSSGNTGYSAQAWRTYYKGDTALRTETLPSSYYAPTGMVYAVGEGTDTSKVDTTQESGDTNPEPTPSPTPTPTPTPEGPESSMPDTPETPGPQEPVSSPMEEVPTASSVSSPDGTVTA